MEMLYKIEGTIWYGDSEVEVQSLQTCLWECFGISSDIFFREEKSTQKFGIQFSFYKKEEEYGFVGAILCLLQLGMPKDGEVIFANSYNGEQHYVICDGWFILE